MCFRKKVVRKDQFLIQNIRLKSFSDMKSCTESALIANIKTSAATEQMVIDSKRKHFKNNMRQLFFFFFFS